MVMKNKEIDNNNQFNIILPSVIKTSRIRFARTFRVYNA